jgi:hypothetical protein
MRSEDLRQRSAPALLAERARIEPAGIVRIFPQTSGGSAGACNGSLAFDFNAYFAQQTSNPSLIWGASVDLQAWYRDPPNPGGANLTNAGSFVLGP